MVNIERILCPVDLSDLSRHTLRHALALAARYRARITILHVYGEPELSPMTWGIADLALPPAVKSDEVAEAVRRFYGPSIDGLEQPVEILARGGPAAPNIVELADELPADVLVLGTHGRSGFERLFLGSVTERVLRTTTVPVMTIPPPAKKPGSTPYQTILCPLDFSEASMHALEYACSLAREANALLILLHVMERLLGEEGLLDIGHMRVSEYDLYLQDDAARRLKAVVSNHPGMPRAPEERIARGRAYREILRVARDARVDLIVMGVQGNNALHRLFFGSTTHHVIREAECAVLTIRG